MHGLPDGASEYQEVKIWVATDMNTWLAFHAPSRYPDLKAFCSKAAGVPTLGESSKWETNCQHCKGVGLNLKCPCQKVNGKSIIAEASLGQQDLLFTACLQEDH